MRMESKLIGYYFRLLIRDTDFCEFFLIARARVAAVELITQASVES